MMESSSTDEKKCSANWPVDQLPREKTWSTAQYAADRLAISWFSPLLWQGDSAFDAWLTASSVQVAPVLLTLPSSFAQMGLASGIGVQIIYGLMGCWTCYVITALYADYRRIKENQNIRFHNHTIQWYEVLHGLLGPRWMVLGLYFNTIYMFFLASIQIVASGSIAFYMNDHFSKRTWTMIFGPIYLLTVLIPTAYNYRVWSFLGIVMTTYTSWYLTIAAVAHGQVPNVKHSGPRKLDLYFVGSTNILYAFGGHGFTVEIMHAMWKPKQFKVVYGYAVLYILSLTITSASTMYWAFGNDLLNNSNAFFFLPKSKFRNAAEVAMLIHEFIQFSFCSLPIHIVCEKALGLHHSKYFYKRAMARVAVVICLWICALMLPFFGIINSTVGSFIVTGAVYIIPCLAHIVYYSNRLNCEDPVEKPICFFKSWRLVFCIDIFIVIWVGIFGVGFGGWASIKYFVNQRYKFVIFGNCFDC